MKLRRMVPFVTLAVLALNLALADLSQAQAPPPPTDAQVDEQIDKLDANDLADRDAAQNQLGKWMNDGVLTPVQIAKVKAVAKDPNPSEVRTRARAVMAILYKKLAAVRAVLDAVTISRGGLVLKNGVPKEAFVFDAMIGFSSPNNPVLTKLEDLYKALRNAVEAGDTAPGAGGAPDPITAAAQAIKDYINSLSAAEFADLGIEINGVPATKQQVLDKVQQAIDGVPAAKNAMDLASGGQTPGEHGRTHVPAGSNVVADVGLTLGLTLAQVTAPGRLDVAKVLEADGTGKAPAGYRVDGEAYDLLAESGLATTGPITISLRYQDAMPAGNPIFDRNALKIARMANGQSILLNSTNDPLSGLISATYAPQPYASGYDQFGEFALVEPQPAPAVAPWGIGLLGMALAGLGALQVARLRRA